MQTPFANAQSFIGSGSRQTSSRASLRPLRVLAIQTHTPAQCAKAGVCAGFIFWPSHIRWPSAPHRAASRPVVPRAPLAPPHRNCARLAPPRGHERPRLRHSPSAIATGLLGVPSQGFAIAHFVGHGLRRVGRSAVAPLVFARPQVADTAAAVQSGQDAPLAMRLRSTSGKVSVRGWPLTERRMR